MFRTILAGLRTFFRRDAVERELDDELRHYLELSTQEQIEAGVPPAAAARAVRAQMGGLEATKERVRSGRWDVRRSRRDVREPFRHIRKPLADVRAPLAETDLVCKHIFCRELQRARNFSNFSSFGGWAVYF